MGWEEEVARLLRLQRMHRKMARAEKMEAEGLEESKVSNERLRWELELLEDADQWSQEFGGEGRPPRAGEPRYEDELARRRRVRDLRRRLASPKEERKRGGDEKDAAVRLAPGPEPPPFSFREASRTPVLKAPPDEQYQTPKQEMEVEGVFAAQDERDGEAQRRRHQRSWEEMDQWPTLYGVFE